MTLKQKVLVAAAFAAPIIAIGIAIYSERTARLRPNLSAIVTKQPAKDKLRKQWAEDDFIQLTDENIKSFAAEVKIESKTELSEAETLELRNTIERFLKAYSGNQDFETFLAFRFPITNGTFAGNLLEYDKSFISKNRQDLLESKKLDSASLRSMSPLDVWRLKLSLPIVQRVTNCWTKVGKKGSVVVVEKSERLPDMTNLGNILTSYDVPSVKTWDISGWSPRFIFDPTPDAIIAQHGKITHALIWLVVQSVRANPAPVYCQVYYYEGAGKWLPCFLGQCKDDSFYLF